MLIVLNLVLHCGLDSQRPTLRTPWSPQKYCLNHCARTCGSNSTTAFGVYQRPSMHEIPINRSRKETADGNRFMK